LTCRIKCFPPLFFILAFSLEEEAQGNLIQGEGLTELVHEIPFVGEVDGAGVPDKKDKSGRLDGDLGDVIKRI
jgi:hypothetical protein